MYYGAMPVFQLFTVEDREKIFSKLLKQGMCLFPVL
jgi:hypothetical protein